MYAYIWLDIPNISAINVSFCQWNSQYLAYDNIYQTYAVMSIFNVQIYVKHNLLAFWLHEKYTTMGCILYCDVMLNWWGFFFLFFSICQMEIFKLQTLRWLQEGYLLFGNKQVTGKTCSCRLHVARVVRCARIPQHKGRMMVNYTKLETVIYKNIKVRSQKTWNYLKNDIV